MKGIKKTGFFFLLILIMISHQLSASNYTKDISDSTKFKSFSGIVKDKETSQPIVFANIHIEGTRKGTVSNSDGEFTIKIPGNYLSGKISISSIGYKILTLPIDALKENQNVIELSLTAYPIEELTIYNMDPYDLLISAKKNISENYSQKPVMMDAFYRETIKKNRTYVSVSEAILKAYKSSYNKIIDSDRVKIFKARKSEDVTKMDTILFKIKGGPYYTFLLDIVKNHGDLISDEAMEFYDYKLSGVTEIEDREAYIISFDQKDFVNYSLYSGRIYLDVETLAIVGAEFGLSQKGIANATNNYILKKPQGMKIEVTSANYISQYRNLNNKWYLNYVRSEVVFKCRWKRRIFNSNYTSTTEMAITDLDFDNIEKYSNRESISARNIFTDEISNFNDPDFWGANNIIRPEESIEEAIQKILK
jgi:CarboxypepD_reg-like domain